MPPVPKRELAIILAVWAALCLCLTLIYGAPPITGELVQSDDYMRMARVQALLDGHPGRNFNEPRMGPAGGAGNAWSPLPDLPLAALVIVFDLFVDRAGAMLWTAALFPPLLLLGFIFACGWAARQGLGERDARWAPAALLLLWPALLPFAPGRVDHHNWQLIALALAFGCLLRARRDPENV